MLLIDCSSVSRPCFLDESDERHFKPRVALGPGNVVLLIASIPNSKLSAHIVSTASLGLRGLYLQNTTDTARPQVVEEQSAVSSPSLMGRSGFSISASDIGTSQMNSEGAASTRFEEGTGSGVVGENGVRVKMFISEDSDDEEPGAARSDGGEGSDDEAREAREGDGESRRRESNTLDGYDFNTIHKVGSFVLGKGSSLTRGLGPMPSSRPQSKRSSSAPESSGGKQVRSSSSLQRAPCRGHGDIGSRDL